MKTYSSKSNARRAAKAQNLNLETLEFTKDEEGRWSWVEEKVIGEFVTCPHCGIHLSNGTMSNLDQFTEMLNDGTSRVKLEEFVTEVKAEFHCLGCGEDFGPELQLELEEKEVKKSKRSEGKRDFTIQKDRPEQNGVRMPSEGSKCKKVWDLAAELYASTGMIPTPKVMKDEVVKRGLCWDFTTVTVQLYRWRDFSGFKGR